MGASIAQRNLCLGLKRELNIAQFWVRPEFGVCVVEFLFFCFFACFFIKVGHKRNDTTSCPHAAECR